jgi:HSP20 family molecular chaperone IbpA
VPLSPEGSTSSEQALPVKLELKGVRRVRGRLVNTSNAPPVRSYARFTLPDSARSEAIKARYVDGVLEIEIPKQPRVEAKRITVTVN